jgi:hypothetical protein
VLSTVLFPLPVTILTMKKIHNRNKNMVINNDEGAGLAQAV